MIGILFRDKVKTQEERQALFESLMQQSYRQSYSFATRLTGNVAEAEDLVQETFIRAFRFFHRYDENLPFTNWLYRIMSNAHIDMVRRKGRLKTTSLEQPSLNGTVNTIDVADTGAGPDRLILDEMMDEHVQHALSAMTPEFRTAVLLADVEGMAYEEIADVMQTSVGTVRSRIHRGRKQLRKTLVKRCPSLYGGMNHDL
jgi:RNA polymerase sigma-70 factor, ECF subfamily